MNSLDGKEVVYGVLQSGPIHCPGIGQIGGTLTSTSTATNKAVKMVVVGDLIQVNATNQGITATVYIPLVNFSHFVIK